MKSGRSGALTAAVLATVLACSAHAQTELTTQHQKFNYAAGAQMARQVLQNFKQQGVEVDAETFAAAVRDALSGGEIQMTDEEMRAAFENQNKVEQEKLAMRVEEGKAFLEKNKAEEGVSVTESGLQYRIIEPGTGAQPDPKDTVVVHYKGTLIDGSEFDSSYSRGEPATFGVTQVIKGWQEALPMMKEGGKWELVIPSDLAYGERGAGGAIGPNETLVFQVELVEIKK